MDAIVRNPGTEDIVHTGAITYSVGTKRSGKIFSHSARDFLLLAKMYLTSSSLMISKFSPIPP